MNLQLKKLLNKYGSQKEPFLFVVSYDLSKYYVKPLKDLPKEISYEINHKVSSKLSKKKMIEKYPIKDTAEL